MKKIFYRMNGIKIPQRYRKGGVFKESEAEIKTPSSSGSNTIYNYHLFS